MESSTHWVQLNFDQVQMMQLLYERWDKSYRTAMQSTIDLELNIFAQRSVDKIEKRFW